MTYQFFFQSFYGWYEQLVFHQTVRIQILLAVDDVEQYGIQQVILFFRIILDDNVFQLFQFTVYVVMFVCKSSDAIMLVQMALQQIIHVGKHFLVFILHVVAYFRYIFIIEFQYQESHIVGTRIIDGINQSPSNPSGG